MRSLARECADEAVEALGRGASPGDIRLGEPQQSGDEIEPCNAASRQVVWTKLKEAPMRRTMGITLMVICASIGLALAPAAAIACESYRPKDTAATVTAVQPHCRLPPTTLQSRGNKSHLAIKATNG
jgi:hypothetical protein